MCYICVEMLKRCVLHTEMLKLYMAKCELKDDREGYFYPRVLPAPGRVRVWERYDTRGAGTGMGLGRKKWDG